MMPTKQDSKLKIGVDSWPNFYKAYRNAHVGWFSLCDAETIAKDAFETGWRYAFALAENWNWYWFLIAFFGGLLTGALAIGCLIRGY